MKVITNPNEGVADKIREGIRKNGGHCPCRLEKTDDTLCVCKNFREQIMSGTPGECHCGLYIALEKEGE